MSKRNPKP